ncbi:M81 family metallopeptidase [Sanguibacter sp. Z1732]|uniref:M81 family metallopeptidase n=1 Tax=Sanguibacter sp. Z1732 TaxID=3435412 RepID=UPI003D9CAB46
MKTAFCLQKLGVSMRIATLGFSHEANTFSSVPADLSQWERAGILEGDQILAQYRDADATISGFLELGRIDPAITVVPLVFTKITPMGTITAEAYDHLVGRMLEALKSQGPWDAVLLAQHGAAVSEEYADADGEFVRRVRELVGPSVRIGVTLDMHANLSELLVQNADVATVYQTNPHIDARPRALEAGQLIAQAVRGQIDPVMALEMPPLAINILRQGTDDSPMRELLAHSRTEMQRSGVLSVSVVEGYPYADVAEMGMSFLAVTDGDHVLARDVATSMARAAWNQRESYDAGAISIEDALLRAQQAVEAPIVLLDTGDNVGAGSPADSTHLLAQAQRMGIEGVFCSLCDPEAVQECRDAGVGETVDLLVGGKTDGLHGSPVRVRGRVRLLTDGRWEDTGQTHGGFRFFNTGPGALLAAEDGHDILLTSRPLGNVSLQQLRAVGLEPTRQPIIIAKGVNSPRAAFEPIAAEMIYVGTPGVTSADLSTFRYRHRRPMSPFDEDVTY